VAKSKVNLTAKETIQPEAGKTIELTVKDRILFADFFPEKANLTDQWISKDIAAKIEIGVAERKELNLRVVQGPNQTARWAWDEKKAKIIKITFSQVEAQFLKDQVERINRSAIPGERGFTMDTAEVATKIKGM